MLALDPNSEFTFGHLELIFGQDNYREAGKKYWLGLIFGRLQVWPSKLKLELELVLMLMLLARTGESSKLSFQRSSRHISNTSRISFHSLHHQHLAIDQAKSSFNPTTAPNEQPTRSIFHLFDCFVPESFPFWVCWALLGRFKLNINTNFNTHLNVVGHY